MHVYVGLQRFFKDHSSPTDVIFTAARRIVGHGVSVEDNNCVGPKEKHQLTHVTVQEDNLQKPEPFRRPRGQSV